MIPRKPGVARVSLRAAEARVAGYRTCAAYAVVGGVASALCGILPFAKHSDFGMGMSWGMIFFGLTTYVLSRLGVTP